MEVAVEGERGAVKARDFDAVVGPLIEPGYRLAVAMLRDPDEAQDAVQEAAVKAWRSLERLRDSDQARAWFLSIVANQCRSTIRRRWWSVVRMPSREATARSPEEPAVQYLDLDRAMQRLSHDDRAILHLFYFLDLPIDEVARVIGISAGAAKTRIYRAVHRLRPELELMEEDLR
jgi:RNA polymerase sigma-70 factor (ECF subfamily)